MGVEAPGRMWRPWLLSEVTLRLRLIRQTLAKVPNLRKGKVRRLRSRDVHEWQPRAASAIVSQEALSGSLSRIEGIDSGV